VLTALNVNEYIFFALNPLQIVSRELSGRACRQSSIQRGRRSRRRQGCISALVQRLSFPHAERGKIAAG